MKHTLRLALLVAVTTAFASLVACAPDPGQSCTSMCTGAGFDSGNADVQPNETNCFCTGDGTVTEEQCTSLCDSLGLATSEVFGNAENPTSACQCAP